MDIAYFDVVKDWALIGFCFRGGWVIFDGLKHLLNRAISQIRR